jgi:hypothetical protein
MDDDQGGSVPDTHLSGGRRTRENLMAVCDLRFFINRPNLRTGSVISMVPTKTDRARPTLIWAIALVAVSAIALWAAKAYMRAERARFEKMETLRMAPFLKLNLPDPDGVLAKIARESLDLQIAFEREGGIICFLIITAPGVLIARLFTRQVSAEQMLRQPGTSACLACVAPVSLRLASMALVALVRRLRPSGIHWINLPHHMSVPLGSAVVGVWLILFLSKSFVNRWDWIEVIGVAIGSYAVLHAVAPNWYTGNRELILIP